MISDQSKDNQFALSSNSIGSINGVLRVGQNMRPNYTVWKRMKPFNFYKISWIDKYRHKVRQKNDW